MMNSQSVKAAFVKACKVKGAFRKMLSPLLMGVTFTGLSLSTFLAPANGEGFQFTPVPVSLIGNGCPPGTVQAVLNGDTLSVSFSSFEAKAPRPKTVSKSCNLRIGMSIPVGFNLQPINVKYIGFADVPNGGNGELNVKLLMAGSVIAVRNDKFAPGFSSSWEGDIPVTVGTVNACFNPVNTTFGINTNITARGLNVPAGAETQVRIDTIDASTGPVTFQLKFAFLPC